MKKSFALALLLIVWLTVPVRAVEPGKAAQIKQRTEAQCQILQSKFNFRINQYEQSRDQHYQIYQGVRKRVADLAEKYEGRGCDMSLVRLDLTEFDSLIQDFASSFRLLKASMSNAQNRACDRSAQEYRQSTQAAFQHSATLRQRSEAVHAFFKNTIKPRLSQELKECRDTRQGE